MKITAASIVKDSEQFIGSMISSISWVDRIVIYNDHSQDGSIEVAKKNAKTELTIIDPLFPFSMFDKLKNGKRNLKNETIVRNAFLEILFYQFKPEALLLIDSDEIMSEALKPVIENLDKSRFDSIALTCTHIFDKKSYLNVFPATWNNIKMVDPHVRILTRFQKYQKGEYQGVPDCFLKPTAKTLCLNGPYHYHLKYAPKKRQENLTFKFMEKQLNKNNTKKYLKSYRFQFPKDLIPIINGYL